MVGGLGVGATGTQRALAKLPGAVTLAFAPYGADVERWSARARADGHEVLLQVPMEPFDYPDNDPGPQTLLTSLDAEQNLDRLHWLMSRFQGYVGIANYMGARFTASEQALAPVLREAAKRGLIYFDDGSSPRSLAGQIAGANNLPFAKADVVARRGADPGRYRPRADAARSDGARARHARSASPARCRSRSSASRAGPRPRKAAASCWCRSARWRSSRSRAEHSIRAATGARSEFRRYRTRRAIVARSSDAIAMPRYEDLPYRPCVGICVLNRDGRVFIGRRIDGPEHIDATHVWQMPQGGIDTGEDPYPAALRELYEETNIRSVEKLGEIEDWLTYDIPREIVGQGLEGQISRPDAEMVRAALHRQGQRDRHRRIRAAGTSRNSSNGAGSRWRSCPTWSCRSSARSMSGW